MKAYALLFVLAFSTVSAFASPEHHKAPPMPKEFDLVKGLVGTWEGTGNMGDGKESPITVVYELSSGGTVVTEKLMPGTPHEMISVYHREGSKMAMTHYCSIGNHPMMTFKKADATSISFEMTKPVGVSSMKEAHMHAVTLTMADANTLAQKWTNFENGKAKGDVTFTLKRKKL